LNRPAAASFIFRVLFKSLSLQLAVFALLIATARADHPPLPLALENPDGPWRMIANERTLADGLKLVAVLMPRAGAPARGLIFNRSASEVEPVPLPTFAAQIRSAVLSIPATRLESQTAERLGYEGQLNRFTCQASDGVYQCEIFAFATGSERWGILQIIRDDLTNLPTAFAALKPEKPIAAGALAVAPFRVKADPITSFPLSLHVTRDPGGVRLARILVTEVPPDSSTEKAGVKVGDEILSLDDRAVSSFAQGVGRRSELGLLLIDRPPGTRLTLEIITPGDSAPRRVILESAHPTGALRW
jgi:hypothetical protein